MSSELWIGESPDGDRSIRFNTSTAQGEEGNQSNTWFLGQLTFPKPLKNGESNWGER